MRETHKSKEFWGKVEHSALAGKGIDIGCGNDPLNETVRKFDKTDGDANQITHYVNDLFDFVYSSHCLEHMHDPKATLHEWWKLVKPGGHLFFCVPDEDLYEQGIFPSICNRDHKNTFTISKKISWSPKSVNVADLARSLPDSEIVQLQIQDFNYDKTLLTPNRKRPPFILTLLYKFYNMLNYRFSINWTSPDRLISRFHPIDQTMRPRTLAQIQCIIKKKN